MKKDIYQDTPQESIHERSHIYQDTPQENMHERGQDRKVKNKKIEKCIKRSNMCGRILSKKMFGLGLKGWISQGRILSWINTSTCESKLQIFLLIIEGTHQGEQGLDKLFQVQNKFGYSLQYALQQIGGGGGIHNTRKVEENTYIGKQVLPLFSFIS